MLPPDTDQLKTRNFWRACSAEFAATLLFVFFNCGNAVASGRLGEHNATLQISLCFGLTITVLAHTFGHVSGGHINPAVTFGLTITSKIDVVKCGMYILSQCLGAIAGAGLLKVVLPEPLASGSLGATLLAADVTVGEGLLLEVIMTYLLLATVFAMVDPGRQNHGLAPLAIGLSIFVCHLIGVPFTGCGINPARSLGPAVVAGKMDDHWVYWVGPLLGGALGAVSYDFWFTEEQAGSAALKHILAKDSGNYSPDDAVPDVPTAGTTTQVVPFDEEAPPQQGAQ